MRAISPDHLIQLDPEALGLFSAVRDGTRLAGAVEPGTLGYAPVDLCAEEHPEMLPVVSAIHGAVQAAIAATTESTLHARTVSAAPSLAAAKTELESSGDVPVQWRAGERPKLDAAVAGWLAALEEVAARVDLPPGVVDISDVASWRVEGPNDGWWHRDN